MTAGPAAELLAGDFFADRTFTDLVLEAADLSGKELQRCTFHRCKLPATRWARSKLEECRFEHCDLTRMAPQELALREVVFQDSKLMGVDWTDLGPLPNASFEACDLRYASFVKLKLRATKFLRCTARESNFIDVDLTEADFSGTDLTDSTIRGCTLAKTNFSRATGVLFDVQHNRVKGARIGLEAALAMARSAGMVVEEFDR